MLDYGPPETENRERWLTALGLAISLQILAGLIIVAAGVLMMSEDMGADLSVRRWTFPILATAFGIFVLSGLVAARATKSRRGWLVLLAPLALLLAALVLG